MEMVKGINANDILILLNWMIRFPNKVDIRERIIPASRLNSVKGTQLALHMAFV